MIKLQYYARLWHQCSEPFCNMQNDEGIVVGPYEVGLLLTLSDLRRRDTGESVACFSMSEGAWLLNVPENFGFYTDIEIWAERARAPDCVPGCYLEDLPDDDRRKDKTLKVCCAPCRCQHCEGRAASGGMWVTVIDKETT